MLGGFYCLICNFCLLILMMLWRVWEWLGCVLNGLMGYCLLLVAMFSSRWCGSRRRCWLMCCGIAVLGGFGSSWSMILRWWLLWLMGSRWWSFGLVLV